MDVSVSATGIADPSLTFRLDGDSLGSATQKRDLKFDLNDDGTLKSLNASSSDRTGAVIANVLKTVATVATTVLALDAKNRGGIANAPVNAGTATEICNEQSYTSLRQADDLRLAIRTQRDLMGQGPPADAAKIAKTIDALAIKLAALTQNELTLSASAPLVLGDGELDTKKNPVVREIRWSISDLSKWFAADPVNDPCMPRNVSVFYGDGNKPCDLKTKLLGLDYTVSGTPAPETARVSSSPCLSPTDPKLIKSCGKTVVLIEPVMGKISVLSADPAVAVLAGEEVATASIPVPQWGAVTYLPIDVKFMQSRNVGFAFDGFGRKSSFSWTSDATAENATSALSDIATNGQSAVTALKGKSSLDKVNDENAALEAAQKNKILKTCQAAMDAGATSCP